MKCCLYTLLFLLCIGGYAQKDSAASKREPYDRKEEILNDGKRYRKYNNYVTLGPGFLSSSIRNDVSKAITFDFQFHIRRQHFQAGVHMSGPNFGDNNNMEAHLGYGKRWEKRSVNFAVAGGIAYFTGVIGIPDSLYESIPFYYQGVGLYASAQAITKLSYDIGIGVEGFAEYHPYQSMGGIKLILFFSGSYRGAKKNYNPHVKSENKK